MIILKFCYRNVTCEDINIKISPLVYDKDSSCTVKILRQREERREIRLENNDRTGFVIEMRHVNM